MIFKREKKNTSGLQKVIHPILGSVRYLHVGSFTDDEVKTTRESLVGRIPEWPDMSSTKYSE